MDLFYSHPNNISGNIIALDDFEAKHILKTLRKKIGDTVDVTDGKGKHYSGKISSIKPKLLLEIYSEKNIQQDVWKVSLGIGFIRPNRLELVLEKCTELGINSFYLFRSEHANYFSDNKDRFEKILRQAIKQSNRFYLPDLHLIPDFKSFIQQTKKITYKIAAIDPESPSINSLTQNIDNGETLICIGPEGGFSESEISLLKENSFKDISLGNYRLRAETAAIAGISILKLLHP